MNSIFSGKYLLLLSVAAIILVVGGVFAWSQMKPNSNQNNVSSEVEYIELEERLEPQKKNNYTQVNSPDVLVGYSYEISPTAEIIFREMGQETWDRGNVILKKHEEEKVIKKDTELSSPGFFAYNAFATSESNIYVLSSGIVDSLAYLITQDYVDIDKGEIVLSVKNEQMKTLRITKNSKAFEVKVLIDDNCGTDLDREGKSAYVVDLLVNGERTNSIASQIEVACASGRDGYSYNPDVLLDETTVSSDFSKVKFSLKGMQLSQGDSKEVWRNEYIFSLDTGTIIKL